MWLTVAQLLAFGALVVGATIALGSGGAVVAVAAVVLIIANELEREERP